MSDEQLPTQSTSATILLVRWLLCLAIATTIAAQAIFTFRGDGTAINAFMFLDLGWSDAQAKQVEQVLMLSVLGVTLLGVIWPRWPLLMPAGLYLLAEACLSTHVGGKPFTDWAPAAAALRFGTPLATAWVLAPYFKKTPTDEPPRDSTTPSFGLWLLKLAVAVVYIAHGCEALWHHPQFIDLIIGTSARFFDVWLEESLVTRMLTVIGVVDIAVGLVLMVCWNRPILAWAALWGLITALSRMTANGWGAYPDVLIRSTHFLVPLAILILVWHHRRRD